MSEKPTYEELEKRIQELERSEVRFKKVEKALRESENRYQAVVEDMPALICSFLPSSEITFVNKAYCECYKKNFEELVGSNFITQIPESEQKAVMEKISALTPESPTLSHQHLVNAPNGKICWQHWTNRAIFDEQGNVISYQSIGQDITEQKRFQKALGERIKELRCLYRISNLIESEKSLPKILQETVNFIPESWQHPEIANSCILLEELFYKTSGNCKYSSQTCPKTSMGREIIVHGQPLGHIRVCYGRDKPQAHEGPFLKEEGHLLNAIAEHLGRLIERSKAQEALREREAQLRTLIETIANPIFYKDIHGRYTGCNKAFEHFIDKSRSEIIGKTVYDITPKETADKLYEMDQLIYAKMGKQRYEWEINTKNGTHKNVIFDKATLHDPEGKITGLVGVLTDITELKHSENLVRKLSQMLIQTQERERQMISCELHDSIAQNLSTLKFYCMQIFNEEPALKGNTRYHLTIMSKLIDRTVRDVRDLAYDLRPPCLDHLGLVHSLNVFCKEFSEKNNIKVDFQVAGMQGLTLISDMEINLYRLVHEGLNNIRKHACATKALIKLIGAYPHIILRIEDNGRGFDVKERERSMIHEKRMGLWSMKERANLLQGKMTIRSQLNKGTKILIKLSLKNTIPDQLPLPLLHPVRELKKRFDDSQGKDFTA